LTTTVSTPVTDLVLAREHIDRVFNAHRPQLTTIRYDIRVYSPKWLS
jgi:hypothetical protein